MDPLTHTLVGANLSATRLGEKTRFAAAALIVGANLPDIDGICYFIDSDLALGFRRGWTHGVLALVLLPLIQAALLMLLDRLRPRGELRADFRQLVLLSAIAIWSHPFLDWLNTYGMRWLMPFDGRWFYGDAVFIMDVWLWLVLGIGYLAGRRASPVLVITAIVIGSWVVRTVARRSPEYLPLLITIMVIFAAALLWKEPLRRPQLARRFAGAALVIAGTYIGARLVLNEATEAAVSRELSRRGHVVTEVMTGPDPITPLEWSVVARTGSVYRYGEFDWSTRELTLQPATTPAWRDSEEWRRAASHPSVWGLVTWLRFPAYEIERKGNVTLVHIWDARRSGAGRRATVVLR